MSILNYYKRKSNTELPTVPVPPKKQNHGLAKKYIDFNLNDLIGDPGLRFPIMDYEPNVRDQVRRAYLQKGPCQPRNHTFPFTNPSGKKARRFSSAWFNKYENWLEYSVQKNAAYCLCCYLFKPDNGEQGGGDCFIGEGYSNWKKPERFDTHVGLTNSAHNEARRMCDSLMNQNQHITTAISKQSDQNRMDYRTRLLASVDCIYFLLRQGLAFRGHDETTESKNLGNFLELLNWLCEHNDGVKAVSLKNAPENLKLTAPNIQREIVRAISIETVNVIIKQIGNSLFSILVDESRDISTKEQMAIVFRYVDKGRVIERFVGIEHVSSTCALSLKKTIDVFFSRHGLSISSLRGQGYDGASNMRGQFNGLKSLILEENDSAFYVHCFAHQLQLALVAVAKKNEDVTGLFSVASKVVNIVGASPKRSDMLRDNQSHAVIEALNNGELLTGRGLNQETTLQRPGDTRWGSHYKTLIGFIHMFSSIIDVLENINEDGTTEQKWDAKVLLGLIQSFSFVLTLHLMRNVLGITNDLSLALQRKDQDIVNAMNLVSICKERLKIMRQSGWDSLFLQVSSFCEINDIQVPNMEEAYVIPGRSRRRVENHTNRIQYEVRLFNYVVDKQLMELNNRFTEATTELLRCVSCLNPNDSFSCFDKQKLIGMSKFYPKDFSKTDFMVLEDQLDTYILYVRSNLEFSGLKGISDLCLKLVETKTDKVFPLVFLLVKLALLLPVATASVERVFSAMNIIKTRLRNRMGDEFMHDSMITYVEKDIMNDLDKEIIMQRFQNMKARRGIL